jgi:glycosyltransferase involved in cell wall biosynthesis
LIPTKGVDVLLDAWEEVEQAELVLRGPFAPFDGQPDWASKTRQRMKTSSGVAWCGPFQADQRQAIYDQADVLVVPSTWEENSPLVVREALAAGLRIVASNVGGIGELAPTARRVPPGDPRALAQALNAEVSTGRGRRPPRHFPMERHLRNLTDHYRAAVLQRETTSSGPL